MEEIGDRDYKLLLQLYNNSTDQLRSPKYIPLLKKYGKQVPGASTVTIFRGISADRLPRGKIIECDHFSYWTDSVIAAKQFTRGKSGTLEKARFYEEVQRLRSGLRSNPSSSAFASGYA